MSISIEWNEKECDHTLDTSKRDTTDYSKADSVSEEFVEHGVKIIQGKKEDETNSDEDESG